MTNNFLVLWNTPIQEWDGQEGLTYSPSSGGAVVPNYCRGGGGVLPEDLGGEQCGLWYFLGIVLVASHKVLSGLLELGSALYGSRQTVKNKKATFSISYITIATAFLRWVFIIIIDLREKAAWSFHIFPDHCTCILKGLWIWDILSKYNTEVMNTLHVFFIHSFMSFQDIVKVCHFLNKRAGFYKGIMDWVT